MNKRNSLIITLLVTTLALSTTACSYGLVQGPPRGHQKQNYVDCTTSNVAPLLDALWAGLNGFGAASTIASRESEIEGLDGKVDSGLVIGVGAAWLTISGVAALQGFRKTKKCRRAKAAAAARRRANRSGPVSRAGPGAAPWMPAMPTTPTTP